MDDTVRADLGSAHLDPIREVAGAPDAVGMLSRHIKVTVLDISRSGCRLESACILPPGTLAVLRVEVDGVEYSDAVRIARCQALDGAGDRFLLGAAFAWLSAAEARSLRRLASRVSSPDGERGRPRSAG